LCPVANLFSELKRRNVVRVGIAYLVISWVLIEVSDTIAPMMSLPEWAPNLVLYVLIIGLPVALFLSWAYEVTPEGVMKTEEVDKSASITHSTGRKLDRVIIAALVLALGYFIWESRFAGESEPADVEQFAEAQTVAEKSVAVLPFHNLSRDVANAQFTDGLHDDLLTQLAKIRDLKVISRTSVLEYRDTTKNTRTIGQELGVSAIMEGGVQRAGNRDQHSTGLVAGSPKTLHILSGHAIQRLGFPDRVTTQDRAKRLQADMFIDQPLRVILQGN